MSTQGRENFDIGSDKSVVPEQEKELLEIEMVGKVVMLLGGTGATGRSILAGTASPIYGECQSQSAKGFGPCHEIGCAKMFPTIPQNVNVSFNN